MIQSSLVPAFLIQKPLAQVLPGQDTLILVILPSLTSVECDDRQLKMNIEQVHNILYLVVMASLALIKYGHKNWESI